MRRLAYELLGNGGVQLDFRSSGDASPRLTADVRRHVFLIFKEILNNVVRHAGATVVRIEVSVAADNWTSWSQTTVVGSTRPGPQMARDYGASSAGHRALAGCCR